MKLLALFLIGVMLMGCTQNAPATNGTGSGGQGSGGTGGASTTVHISNFAFAPAEITVKQGTTVTWINDDNVPHIIRIPGKPDSQTLSKGDTYSFTFTDAPGEYDYSCGIHAFMHGKVFVTG